MGENGKRLGRIEQHDNAPIIERPGPGCDHPQRLCLARREDCPHALTWLIGRHGYHPTRCHRDQDGEPMSSEEIATLLGVTRQAVNMLIGRATERLRAELDARGGL